MKLGTVVVCGLAALCAITAVTLPEKKDDSEEKAWRSLEVYKNKLMYSEAIKQYKTIINKTPYEESYELVIELRDYCKEVGEENAYIDACRMAVERDPSDYQSAEEVLNYYYENSSGEMYTYIHKLMNAKDVSDEAYQHYSDFYDTIKGRYSLHHLAVQSVGEWCNDSFALADYDGENDCVINTQGDFLVKGEYGKIDSYSADQKYIAILDNEQKVYVDLNSRRKLVPYNYDSDELVYYDYLGRLENGMANFCYDENKWGYLTSSMSVKYKGLEAALPLSEKLFAYKYEGKWNIYYHGSEDLYVYSCDELYVDGEAFTGRCVTSTKAQTRTYYIYAKNSGDSGWSAVKLVLDFSKKDTTVSAEKLGTLTFEDVRLFSGKAGAVKINGAWQFIDSKGEVIEAMGKYSDARSMSCGLCAAVGENGMWGYIDSKGQFVIEPQFKEAYPLCSAGTAVVRSSDGWYLLSLSEYK